MKQKVVVIGHGYTSRLGVIRALGKAGYEVVVIVMTPNRVESTQAYSKPIDCYSKHVNQFYFCPSNPESLVNLLLEKCIDTKQKVVVFADSDFSEAVVDENQERLRPYFLFPHINHEQGAVVAWMDKLRQKETAMSVGLNVAEGCVIDVKDRVYTIPEDVKYPCFPKPLATLKGGKRGLKRCNDESELRSVMSVITEKDPTIKVLVEEYKVIDVEQALLGFTDGKDVVIPGIIKTLSLANGGHFGVAKQGMILPVIGYEDLVEKFKKFVLKTGFVGIFDIDFYQSEGLFFFCEMNFRYGGSGYAYTAMGVNLPAMLVRTLLGESINGMQLEIKKDAVFVNERMCLDDWYSGYITTKEFRHLLNTADISFVNDLHDIEPMRAFKKVVNNPICNMKRIVKKILK